MDDYFEVIKKARTEIEKKWGTIPNLNNGCNEMDYNYKITKELRVEIVKGWIMASNFSCGCKEAEEAPFYLNCQKCGSGQIELNTNHTENKHSVPHFYCEECGEIMK
jgi:hypothetical protein